MVSENLVRSTPSNVWNALIMCEVPNAYINGRQPLSVLVKLAIHFLGLRAVIVDISDIMFDALTDTVILFGPRLSLSVVLVPLLVFGLTIRPCLLTPILDICCVGEVI